MMQNQKKKHQKKMKKKILKYKFKKSDIFKYIGFFKFKL